MIHKLKQWLALTGLVALGWLAPGLHQVASAQTVTTCHPAEEKGVDGPVDYGAYCWIDFTPLNLAQAKIGAGQAFRVNLRGGAYLTFSLRITPGNAAGDNMFSVAVPSWSGAAFGNSAFNEIPGRPILYQDTNNQNAPQDTVTLSGLTLHDNGSTELPFVFVAADGESSNAGETLSFTTSGAAWSLVSAPGESNPARNMPILSPATLVGNSTGVQTVNIAGTDAGPDGEGSYVFTTDNSPGTVTATMLGNGLQGVLFGVKYHTIGLSLTKTHVGEFKAGGTGTYIINTANTVTYPEINPPTTPQPIRVVDTLPAGLTYVSASGTGWSCSAVGQVVTCNTTSLQDLTTSRTFPPITLVVDIASDAPATLINLAEVSDPTTSTLVFNVCEVADNGVCPNSATSSTGHETDVLHSNLSTSTKSVLDKNGGEARPGDVLRYTITLVESDGVDATGISVDDHMPANVGNLTIIGTPAGSTDNSTTNGGNNGTGRVRINGITVPANGSVTIVYEVTIAGGTPDGTTIDNTAVVTNPDTAGAGASAVAPTVTVTPPQVPGAPGNKILYLYNTGNAAGNRYMNRTPQTNAGTARAMNEGATYEYLLNPVLAGTLQLTPGSTVRVELTVQRTGSGGGNTARSMSAQLYKKNGATYTSIGSDTVNFTSTTYHTETFTFTVPNTSAANLAAGNQLALRVTNTSSGGGTRSVNLNQFTGGLRSTVSFDTTTVINVDSVQPYANANCTGSPVTTPYVAGGTVYLCAVVSDPFGSDDIAPSPNGTIPSILVSDADGVAIGSGTMTQVASSTATKTFRYTYTVPPTTSLGAWTAKVTAWEGTEGTVIRTGSGTFDVAGPSPDLSTSSKTVEDRNGGDAMNGDVLRYTITLAESAGAAAGNVSVIDDMPAHVGSLTVISRPAGSTDSSTTGGGANGTGRLNITGITVPAGSSVAIVYEVTITGNPAAGTTIDNSADIDNPDGADETVSAPTVTVNASSGTQTGNKYLYLRNEATITRKLSRSRPTANGTTVAINAGNNQNEWELSPAIPNGETLALPTTIGGNVVIAATGTTGSNTNRTVRLSLWRGAQQLGNNTDITVSGTATGPTAYSFNITGIAPGTTLSPAQTLTLRIQNRGSGSRNIDVYQRNGATWTSSYSHLVFNTSTVINIDAAAAYSQPLSAGNGTKAAYIEDEHVYLRATVSDPFGTDDIGAVSVSIKNPTGVEVASGAMTPQPDTDATDGSLTYEFVFTVPTNAPLGGWTATVTAKEGVENMVDDVANIGFIVQGQVSLGKTWGLDATPGDTVMLTIAGATASTAGTSTAGGSTTAATGAAAGGATLTLGETFTTGSAGNYTVTLACVRTKDGVAVATSGIGLSRTIVMPADSGVACTWTNAKTVSLTVVKLSMVHSDPVNGTSNPKAIPGAFVDYLITIMNPSTVPVDPDSVWLTDMIPDELMMVVADLVAPGSGPVEFTDGSPASGLHLGISDVEFSSDGGATWAYVPTAGSDGTDALVKALRINPKGTFNPNNAAFQVRFRTRVR
ncbi:hypothetical protein QAA18_04015 [Luteimonas sp. 8-5]|nr:hypothetical protein [Luteimonas sp. 8-5]